MAASDDGGGRCAGRFLTALALGLASCATPEPAEPVWVRPETEVATFDPSGRPTSGADLATEVRGLGPDRPFEPVPWSELGIADADQDPAAQDPPAQDPAAPAQDPEEERRRQQALIRIAFGDDVLIGDDGRVTKQYFLSQDAGNVFLNLMAPIAPAAQAPPKPPVPLTHFGGQDTDSVLNRLLGPEHEVEIVYLQNFETGGNIVPRANPSAAQSSIRPDAISNSLLLVTAQPASLAAFEKALNLFYANIPQVEIEVKVVEFSTTDTLNFGIVPIDANTPTLQNLSSGQLVRDITSNFPSSAPLTGGTTSTGQGLITLGGIHDSWELNATLQMLETNNLADIQSTPKLVVRSGGLATVRTTTSQPFPKAKITNQTTVATDISFKDVGIIMDIRPEIAGTDTVILNVYASVSAIVGFVPSEPVPTPIVATREAATSVHLRVGETTVIGGLIADTTIDVESKLPILGDIPILGYLFRSTSTQKSKTTLEFHITPKILRGSRGRAADSGF